MLPFSSILNETGKSSIEALHYYKTDKKSFKNLSFRQSTDDDDDDIKNTFYWKFWVCGHAAYPSVS